MKFLFSIVIMLSLPFCHAPIKNPDQPADKPEFDQDYYRNIL